MLVGSENTNEFPYSFIDSILEHKAEILALTVTWSLLNLNIRLAVICACVERC